MSQKKPVYIISDQPEREQVAFGFAADALTLAELIAFSKNDTPFFVGIFGSWGSGKTTLMQTIRRLLLDDAEMYRDGIRPYKTVWFQAWRYRGHEQILTDLFQTILKTMQADGFLLWCRAALTEGVQNFQFLKSAKHLSRLLDETMDVEDVVDCIPAHDLPGFNESFMDDFEQLLWEYINWQPHLPMTEAAQDRSGALVVFIDDLDRCPPDQMVRILETIKLFMDRQGWVFVIGAEFELLKNALRNRYSEQDALQFIDKMVQVSYHLPRISDSAFLDFIAELSPEFNDMPDEIVAPIRAATRNNPRRLKRFLNNMALREGILRNRRLNVEHRHLLSWSIIEYAFPGFFRDLREHPSLLELLREKIQVARKAMGKSDRWDPSDELLEKIGLPESLSVYVRDASLVSILESFDVDDDTLEQLITASNVVQATVSGGKRTPVADFAAMAVIPSSAFLFGDDRESGVIEAPYSIDIYPVTNIRFRPFVENGGYQREEFWSKEGWRWRESKEILYPRYWTDSDWVADDRPVVGISWFEADAFCRWLTAESGEEAAYRLPTEKEWERASRGTDGREYPWGEAFDGECCNTAENKLGRTTRVTKYPNGISPEGCYDMAGNVFEWTATLFDTGSSGVVLRGGSWFANSNVATCAFRYDRPPWSRLNYVGFRCARNLA